MENTTIPELANEASKTFETSLEDIGRKLLNSAPTLVGIGIAIWWIFYGMVEIYPTELSLTDRIGLTICTIVLAVTYGNLISIGGFKSAKKTEAYQSLAKDWNDAIIKGNQHKREIILYAKSIALDNQRVVRTENLEKIGIKYKEVFNEKGELICLNYRKEKIVVLNKKGKEKKIRRFVREQRRMIKKCINLRIEIPEMFGNVSSKFFGLKKRATQKSYEIKSTTKNTIVRVLISVFSVGFMFKWMGFSAGATIYALFQIVLWTASGILERIKNFNFIVNEIQPQILENTLTINGYLKLSEEERKKYQEESENGN